jgi:hypothetical protein
VEYSVDAAGLEPAFNEFLEYAYGGNPSGGAADGPGARHKWHEHNPIFVINPDKARPGGGMTGVTGVTGRHGRGVPRGRGWVG